MSETIALSKLRPADPRGSVYRELEDFGFDEDNSPSNIRSKHQVTKKIKKFGFRKKKYKSITDEMREELITCIENEGLKIKHAAKKLRMNYSSAKSIFKIYKREGRLNKKIFKRRAENLEDGDLEGTPMSDDLESSHNDHESESPVVPKQEFSTPEAIERQTSVKIVIQAQENYEKAQNSPLLKREEVDLSSQSSLNDQRDDLKQRVKVQEDLFQPHNSHYFLPTNNPNFSVENLVKQRPFLFGDSTVSKDGYFKTMHHPPMFPSKLPGGFPPTGLIPSMDPLQILGQSIPSTLQFIPQHPMSQINPLLANKMNPYFPNPYMQNMNGLEPLINYSLFNHLGGYPIRMNGNNAPNRHSPSS